MGQIFEARDLLTNQVVALKQVTLGNHKLAFATTLANPTTDFRVALAQEFRLLSSLRHPHIISVLDYGFDDLQRPYFTMDLLKSPKNIVDHTQAFTVQEKISVLIQVAQALDYLHRRGIIHRDLKPDNVLVENDVVKVLDFGLAVQVERESLKGGEMAGTLGYMAPELLLGEVPSETSDLYALGVMAYEVLIGHHPYDVANPSNLMMDILYGELSFDDLQLEPKLKTILQRLLDKEPSDRIQTAAEAANRLARAIGLPSVIETATIRESYIQAANFVGREHQMARLSSALEGLLNPLNPKASAWLIGGESGVGKSRLLEEIRVLALVKGARVLQGRSLASSTPFQLWRGVIRRLALTTTLDETQVSILSEIVPDIGALLERDVQPPPSANGRTVMERLAKAISELINVQQRPLLLILEDLQWAEESIELLNKIINRTKGSALMVVGSYRNEETPNLPNQLPQMENIVLERLSREEIEALSVSILGERVGRQENVLGLLERETEGNVFFLVEVVRALAEEAGKLSNIGVITLPQSVFSGSMRTVIERRLSRLPLDAQPMLRLAAVFGREIDLDILRSIDPVMNYDTWLMTCANAAILEVSGDVWRFTHDRMRDGILDALDPHEVPRLNDMIAYAIESVYPDDPSYAVRLMVHYNLAGDSQQVAHYAQIAGQQAYAVSDYQEALALFSQAASIWQKDTPARIFIYQGDIHYQLGNFKAARASLKMAMQREMDDNEQVRVLAILGDMALEKGRYYRSERILLEALETAQKSNLAALSIRILLSLGESSISQRRFDDARIYFDRVTPILQATQNTAGMLRMMALRARLYHLTGELNAAHKLLEKAHDLAESTNNPERTMYIANLQGDIARERNNLLRAEKFYMVAIELAYTLGLQQPLSLFVTNLAWVRILRGDVATARHDLHEALERAAEFDLPPMLVYTTLIQAIYEHHAEHYELAYTLLGLVSRHWAYGAMHSHIVRQLIATWGVSDVMLQQASDGVDFEKQISEMLGWAYQTSSSW